MEHQRITHKLADLLGERFKIDDVDKTSENSLSEAAFELYKETIGVVNVAAHVYVEDPNQEGLPRNQAINVGLLVRIAKFMMTVLQLSADSDRGDVVLALNRSILESAANLQYLATKNDERSYSQYVASSLGPEKALYDTIQQAIKDRGSVLPIEARMLKSIERTCQASGFSIEKINSKHGDWGGGLRERLRALGLEDKYVMIQRIPSHAIHGTWVDLLMNHLKENAGRFEPDTSWRAVDSRLLSPIALFVLDAVAAYFEIFLSEHQETRIIATRAADLVERLRFIDERHEMLLSANRVP